MVLPEGKPWKRSLTGSQGPTAARAAAFERLMKTSQSKHNIKTLLAALHHLECKSLCSARPLRFVAEESVLSSNMDLLTFLPSLSVLLKKKKYLKNIVKDQLLWEGGWRGSVHLKWPQFFSVPGISVHKLNTHIAEQAGLGCFVDPCVLFDLDSFTWQLTGVDFMSSLCHRLKGKSNPLFAQHIPSNPLSRTDENRGEKCKLSHHHNAYFITFYAKFKCVVIIPPSICRWPVLLTAVSGCSHCQTFEMPHTLVLRCGIWVAPDRLSYAWGHQEGFFADWRNHCEHLQ